jgi:hypothetical protein
MAAPFLFPVGQDLGPVFTNPDATMPERYDIRISDGVVMLEAPEYQLWWLAHSTPDLVKANNGWDRSQVESYAAHYNIANAGDAIDQLVADQVLAQVDSEEDAIRAFALEHRIFPLQRSLGNTAAEPFTYKLGMTPEAAVSVDIDVFQLWTFGHQSESLYHAAVTLAKQRADNEEMPDEMIPTAEELTEDFVLALPGLLASQVLYLDRRD